MPAWTAAYVYGFWPLLFAACAASWRFGDPPVRIAAATLLAAMLVGLAAISPLGWYRFETAALVVDALFMAALLSVTIQWPRWWLLAMAATQLLVLTGYAAKLLYPEISRLAYAILVGTGPYIQLILLSIGCLLAIRTRRSMDDRHA